MKKSALIFTLLSAIFWAGCGANGEPAISNSDAKEGTEVMQIEWKRSEDVEQPRGGYFAAWHNGGLWIGGGSYWKDGEKLWTVESSFFDPKTEKWSKAVPIPKAFGYGVTAAVGDDIYILGGVDENGKANRDVYRLRDGKWETTGSSPADIIYPAYATVGSKVYVFGGSSAVSDVKKSTNETYIYNTAANEWSKADPIPGVARQIFSASAVGTTIYVFGGLTQRPGEEIENLDDAYSFETTTGKWKAIKKMPVKMRAFWAGTDGKSIYLIGGYSDAGLDSVYRYSPKTDEYELISKLPQPLMDTKFIYNDGYFYGASGEDKPASRFSGIVIGTVKEGGQ